MQGHLPKRQELLKMTEEDRTELFESLVFKGRFESKVNVSSI